MDYTYLYIVLKHVVVTLLILSVEKPATKLPLEKPALSIPPINWPTEYCIVTLSTVCSGHGCQGIYIYTIVLFFLQYQCMQVKLMAKYKYVKDRMAQ